MLLKKFLLFGQILTFIDFLNDLSSFCGEDFPYISHLKTDIPCVSYNGCCIKTRGGIFLGAFIHHA
jgi:hypothetical protein